MNDGKVFEAAVDRWLQRLGARRTERRERVQGQVAKHGHEVDVHAVFAHGAWQVWLTWMAVGGVGFIVGLAVDNAPCAVVGGAVLTIASVLLLVSLAGSRHVWVECKSSDQTVRRDVVWKLMNQVRDVREAYPHAAQWYPEETWLVARSRFDVDALAFAKANGVRCFVEQAGDIREVI